MFCCCAENAAHGAENRFCVEPGFRARILYAGECIAEDDVPQFLANSCACAIGITISAFGCDAARLADQVYSIFQGAAALQAGKADREDRMFCGGGFRHGSILLISLCKSTGMAVAHL